MKDNETLTRTLTLKSRAFVDIELMNKDVVNVHQLKQMLIDYLSKEIQESTDRKPLILPIFMTVRSTSEEFGMESELILDETILEVKQPNRRTSNINKPQSDELTTPKSSKPKPRATGFKKKQLKSDEAKRPILKAIKNLRPKTE